MKENRSLVDKELSSLAQSISHMSLAPQLNSVLLSRGKRLRSVMLMECAELVGGMRDEVLPLGIAIELLHAATLVQDDIIDKEEERRGKTSLHRKWSVGDAILVADCLICFAIDKAADFGVDVLKTIARTGLSLCDGEHLDLNSLLDTTLEDEYFSSVEGKSASLFRTAAYCGGLVGGGDVSQINLLADFGKHYGIAYQIKDDIIDFRERDGIPRDLKNAKPTLPIIHLYENCNKETREIINDVFNLHRIDARNVREIQRELRKAGSLEYSLSVLNQIADQARLVLTYFPECESKSCLNHLVDILSPATMGLEPKGVGT
jgi:octaprenyl-diphosphate synthase